VYTWKHCQKERFSKSKTSRHSFAASRGFRPNGALASIINLAWTTFNRQQVIKSLWLKYIHDAVVVETLVVILSRLDLVIWWCSAKGSITTTFIQQFVSHLTVFC
jgi:hypothetical protein